MLKHGPSPADYALVKYVTFTCPGWSDARHFLADTGTAPEENVARFAQYMFRRRRPAYANPLRGELAA